MNMLGRALLGFIQRELGSQNAALIHPPCQSDAVGVVRAADETPTVIGELPLHGSIVLPRKSDCQPGPSHARIPLMRIQIKLIANFRELLPPGSKNGIVELDLPNGTTVREAITRFDIPLDGSSVIVLNGLTVDLNTPLNEGDRITAFSAIEGGSTYRQGDDDVRLAPANPAS